MNRFIDLTGQRFGKLIVDKYIGKNKWRHIRWLCSCDCGNKSEISGCNLLSGKTKSCGCFAKQIKTKHGYAKRNKKLRVYQIWCDMKKRCNNKNAQFYRDYGGRNIKVCYRWANKKNGFQNFLEDMGEPPSTKHQIDRINNSLGYYKENCRWVTSKENNRNRRDNRVFKYNNKDQCVSALAEKYNIKRSTLSSRINRDKLSIEEALTIPINKQQRRKKNARRN